MAKLLWSLCSGNGPTFTAVFPLLRPFTTAAAALHGHELPPPSLLPPQRPPQQVLRAWLQYNEAVPAVRFMQGTQPPTALSWLRRRGPDVPHGLLFKLFRSRTVGSEEISNDRCKHTP